MKTDQPCKIAILKNFTPNCNYCSIGFIDIPFSMTTESMTLTTLYSTATESITLDIPFDDVIPKEFFGTPLYFAVIIPIGNLGLNVKILKVTNTEVSRTSRYRELKYHCIVIDANVHVVELIKSAYRRWCLDSKDIVEPISASVREQFKNAYREIEVVKNAFNEIYGLGGNSMLKIVPVIDRCIINDPAVIIFWSDGTKTIGKCMDNDEFNPEVGLAMAISRKFYKILGFPNPRSAFKNQLKNAEDRSAKTQEKRDRKKNNSEAINETEEA